MNLGRYEPDGYTPPLWMWLGVLAMALYLALPAFDQQTAWLVTP